MRPIPGAICVLTAVMFVKPKRSRICSVYRLWVLSTQARYHGVEEISVVFDHV